MISKEDTLEYALGELLSARGLTLAVAESCTGGLIGHRITNIAGSSAYYLGSITAYAYEAKVRLLGVSWNSLNQYGAVSEQVALEMARGVRKALGANLGISVTGIAGPGGGTPEKPVGTVWIGLSAGGKIIAGNEKAYHFVWQGDRAENKRQSADAALQIALNFLKEVDENQTSTN